MLDCSPIQLFSGCKVNFGLRITGVRANGYHELDSVFYPLPYPRDTMTLRRVQRNGIRLSCATPGIDPENNILTKAYGIFAKVVGMSRGLDVVLRKRIPCGAGLGGGSGNAGALLRWLNEERESPMDSRSLAELALAVGADTPFFLQDSPCRVQGVGERLTPVATDLSGCCLVLVCPDLQVRTPQAYVAYDALSASSNFFSGQSGLTKFLSRDREFPLFDIGWRIYSCDDLKNDLVNDLEAAVFPVYPQLAAIKAELIRLGADAAGMSGSGSSLFGLFFRNRVGAAKKAASALRSGKGRVFLLRL
ncbi:MAG: 4-(cytidine 5'-diphospho)-2-C-methyl-D-erythritol kinase [Desulfovibrio sp.]|jgi:4-diphosphocytidyl-2-C-methyl-D-erythritol kinase|nr:4-(cytidine 5'-diphospho)-2-C-methyl-D-erythritol kinase [Desulfovibrio sp.]